MKQITIALSIATLLATSMVSAQICTNNVYEKIDNNRYEILGNGSEVRDKQTNLIWQRCSLGQKWDGVTCTGQKTKYDWQSALTVVKQLGSAYRLPNVKELQSLANYSCTSPAVNTNIFPKIGSKYWSSTTTVNYIEGAHVMDTDRGTIGQANVKSELYIIVIRGENK